jgi:hypothetical protein
MGVNNGDHSEIKVVTHKDACYSLSSHQQEDDGEEKRRN